ncbi:MAG: hypothetical protein OEZ47_08340 [Gammaproteobacteria bacterium]|nr:hypothetical protein [Gammaproteobacteria bacterium]
MYEFWYGRNPIRYKLLNGVGTDEYFFHNVQKRAYFVAVAEDAFMGNRNDPASGRSVFKVIVAEDGTGTTLDLRGALDPSTWDKEFHLWAAYKKILKTQYDARHYLVSHGMSEAPVKVWKHDTASEYSFPARGYDQSVYSDWGNMSVTADGSRYIIFKDNRLQVLGENTRPTGIYGETEDILVLLGECDPFEGSGATSRRAVTHPTDSRLVLVGDGRSEYSYDYFRQGSSYVPYGTHEARVIDISNIQSGVCPVHNAHQFVHPVLDTFLGTHIAGFSPDGTKVLTWGNTYIPITLGPTFASYELRLNFWVWDISSNTLVHSAQIPLRPNEPGLKTQEGSVLALDSTSTKVLGENYKGANWVYDMETGGTLYLQGATRTNNRAMYNTFFHPQGFNQVIQTMDADSGTIDGVSVTFPPRLYRWNLDAWDSTQAITEWYVHTAIPRQLLQTEDREYVSGQGDGKISYAFLSGDKNQIALTSAQGRNPTGQFEFYSFRPTGEIISRPKRFYTQFVGVHASASGIDYQPVQNPVNNKVFFIYPSGLNGTLETILLNLEADPDLDSGFTYVHDGRVNTVTFSKDDNYILSGGSDGKAAIWTAIQGDLVITLEGHSDEVTRAVFTHDGKGVATSSLDGTALLWDTDINSTGWGTVRQTLTGHTGPINLIDYDNNFNRHRYATAGDDGSIHIYEETGSTTVFSNLFMDAGIPQPVSYVDFSHDGRYLVAGGKTATNNIVVIDTDPDVLYNGQAYNLLGSLTIHQNFVNSVMFFPGDNTRIFSAGEDTTSRVNTLSYTPNGTNPPLVSATQRVQIDTFSTRAYVTNQWHGLIVGRLCVNSGSCYDAPQITHWDLNEGATEGLQFSASTAPIGPRRYIDNTGQMQNRGILYWAEANSDGTRVVGAHQGSNQFDPRWVEFDEWFNEPDPERPGLPLRPDEGEEVNYYYTESATSSSANADQACYIWDIAARTCATSCLAVGGCDGYTVKSQWQYTQDGTAPPTGSFMRLLVEMGRLEQDTYPDTWGYNLDSFVAEPLL